MNLSLTRLLTSFLKTRRRERRDSARGDSGPQSKRIILQSIIIPKLMITLAGDGLCLLELLPELPRAWLEPDPDLALSLSGFLSSLTLELELGGLLPARLFPLKINNCVK